MKKTKIANKEKKENIKIVCIGKGLKNICLDLQKKEDIFTGYITRTTEYNDGISKNKIYIEEIVPFNYDLAREILKKYEKEIRKTFLDGTKVLIVVSTLGGSVGSNFAPYIVEMAENEGILTLPVLILPFPFEGKRRRNIALEAVEKIKKFNDNFMIFDNEKFYNNINKKITLKEAYDKINDELLQIIELLTDELKKTDDNKNIKSKINEIRQGKYMAYYEGKKTIPTKDLQKDLKAIKKLIFSDIDDYINELTEIIEEKKKQKNCSFRLPLLLAFLIKQKEIIEEGGADF